MSQTRALGRFVLRLTRFSNEEEYKNGHVQESPLELVVRHIGWGSTGDTN
jgi:hypothetical protein